MPYLLDADWVIQALAKRSPAVEVVREIGPADLAISWVTVGEIYEGGFGGRNPQAELATLRAFLQPIQALGLDDAVITRFAELRALLRRQGQLIRRTKVIGRFPGETSCLSLCWAVLDLVVGGGRGPGLTDLTAVDVTSLSPTQTGRVVSRQVV